MSSGAFSEPDEELVLEEWAAFFLRRFRKQAMIVTVRAITTIARQTIRIKIDADSCSSFLAPDPEFSTLFPEKKFENEIPTDPYSYFSENRKYETIKMYLLGTTLR